MPEAVEEKVVETPNTEAEEVELSPAEEKALNSGWMPEEDWIEAGNDPEDWVDAKTFNRNGEFMDRIHKQKREIQDLRASIDDLKKLHGKVAEVERKKVIDELKRAKAIAMEQEDYDTVVDIDEKMADVKAQTKQAAPQPGPDPVFTRDFNDWRAKNQWYDTNGAMHDAADAYGERLARSGMHYKDVFENVEEYIKKEFPEKFRNPARTQSAVDGGSRTSSSRGSSRSTQSKVKFSDLPEEAQRTAKRFERQGVMSIDDYIKDYMTSGGL